MTLTSFDKKLGAIYYTVPDYLFIYLRMDYHLIPGLRSLLKANNAHARWTAMEVQDEMWPDKQDVVLFSES